MVWQYNYPISYAPYDELYHWGIKGMKWGVRRFQNDDGTLTAAGRQRYKDYKEDVKTRKKLTRRVSAAEKNMREKGDAINDAQSKYDAANQELRKANSKIFVGRKKRQEMVDAATQKVREASEELEPRRAELNRAERIYKQDAEALSKHVDSMMSKYGSENVKAISTKRMDVGEHFTADVIKTGITLADIPGIGRAYSGRYISRREYEDREERMSERADRRY